jgi:adenine-specific DNA-methyltransferase
LIDDLRRQSKARRDEASPPMPDLFADFNGLPDKEALTEFYQHDANWSNRMILGDSLSVMASLAERVGLRGKVQCIYLDPPYGIRFNSNFQWSTTSRDVKDGNKDHITREPEQVKAFRDTWRDGIHSYLTYLRDRLTVARDLLTDSGSIFVQIGDENIHLVRGLMDEVFGDGNFCTQITFRKTSGANSPFAKVNVLASVTDYILWYAKDIDKLKCRQLYQAKNVGGGGGAQYTWVQKDADPPRPIRRVKTALLNKSSPREIGYSGQTRFRQLDLATLFRSRLNLGNTYLSHPRTRIGRRRCRVCVHWVTLVE